MQNGMDKIIKMQGMPKSEWHLWMRHWLNWPGLWGKWTRVMNRFNMFQSSHGAPGIWVILIPDKWRRRRLLAEGVQNIREKVQTIGASSFPRFYQSRILRFGLCLDSCQCTSFDAWWFCWPWMPPPSSLDWNKLVLRTASWSVALWFTVHSIGSNYWLFWPHSLCNACVENLQMPKENN